ncbi:MAG: cupin-like domain-containing protein [Saprospiraceae bacterium]|nr:cupin-like domain-containing protein [Saprospiraceae bacterium]
MELKTLEKVTGLDRESFTQKYLNPLQPVVFTDLTKDWSALRRWTVENLKKNYGNLSVPIYTNNYSKPGKGYMVPDKHLPFGEFLDLLVGEEACDLRLFLFNIFRHAPEMKADFHVPDIMDGFYNDFPFMFFGGKGSKVAMHYDIDMSHVFLNQIYGRKRVVLFSPDQSRILYHLPYTVASYVDINQPDYKAFPALKYAKGYEVMLNPGESLFIPSGYWHYIEYTDGGYSISLRANESMRRRIKGAVKIATHFVVDKGMNKIMGTRWRTIKDRMAVNRANAFLKSNSSKS